MAFTLSIPSPLPFRPLLFYLFPCRLSRRNSYSAQDVQKKAEADRKKAEAKAQLEAEEAELSRPATAKGKGKAPAGGAGGSKVTRAQVPVRIYISVT